MTELRVVSQKEEVRQEVIDALQSLVEEAKRGEIDGFYGVVTKPNGNHETVCTASLSVTQKMGCMMQAVIDLANARE